MSTIIKTFLGLAILFVVLISPLAWAEEEATTETTESSAPTPNIAEAMPEATEREEEEVLPLLTVGARIDSAFMTGGPIQQGFSIPSVRLTAFGRVSPSVGYRLSIGQTREFSSLLIPQLVPVEGYIDIGKDVPTRSSPLRWRIGMFTPTFNPWWTPDLSDVELPDYHHLHRQTLISRDLGTEFVYRVSSIFTATAGAFNGNGIYGLNTNSSRAFTGSLRGKMRAGRAEWSVGVSGYAAYQSSTASVNYRSDWMTDTFISFHYIPWNLEIGAEFLAGRFMNYVDTVDTAGVAGYAKLGIEDWMSLFARVEHAPQAPPSGARLFHLQVGPQIYFAKGVYAFLLFDSLDQGSGFENTGLIRIRLTI